MNPEKKKRLQANGYAIGDAKDFVGLSDEESAFIEIKIACGRRLRQKRAQSDLPQRELARKIGTSQPRLAQMEKGDRSVTLDLLIRALLALGDSPAHTKATRRAQSRSKMGAICGAPIKIKSLCFPHRKSKRFTATAFCSSTMSSIRARSPSNGFGAPFL